MLNNSTGHQLFRNVAWGGRRNERLECFIPDLEMLRGMGKRCYGLLDTIMDFPSTERNRGTSVASSDLTLIEALGPAHDQPNRACQRTDTGRVLIVET